MKVELSETNYDKIKTARSVLDLISSCATDTEIMESVRQVATNAFIDLSDVIDEIRRSSSFSDEDGAA